MDGIVHVKFCWQSFNEYKSERARERRLWLLRSLLRLSSFLSLSHVLKKLWLVLLNFSLLPTSLTHSSQYNISTVASLPLSLSFSFSLRWCYFHPHQHSDHITHFDFLKAHHFSLANTCYNKNFLLSTSITDHSSSTPASAFGRRVKILRNNKGETVDIDRSSTWSIWWTDKFFRAICFKLNTFLRFTSTKEQRTRQSTTQWLHRW